MAKTIGNGLALSGQRITNVGDGTAPGDAVTKSQLDALVRGLQWKRSVIAATTANIALTGNQSVDGVAITAGMRVLVKTQTTASENGIYISSSGAWSRATDFDDSTEVTSAVVVSVERGTENGDAAFLLTSDGVITVGTTAMVWGRLGGTGITYSAGNGLQISGAVFSVLAKASGGLLVDSNGVSIDVSQLAALGIMRKVSGTIPDGSSSPVLTHNLGTRDVVVEIYEVSTNSLVETDVTTPTVNTVVPTFAVAPTSGQYRYVIGG